MPGAFNPANAQMRVGHETYEGIYPTTWHDHKFSSETLSGEQSEIQLDDIVNKSQAERGLTGTAKVDGAVEFNLDPESYLPYFVNAQGKNSTTSPATDVYLHRLAPSEADDAPNTLSCEVWRDDDLGQVFSGGRVKELGLSLEINGVLRVTSDMLFSRYTYFGDYVEEVPGATPQTSKPQVRGLPNYVNWTGAAAADRRIHVKVTNIGGSPTSFIATAKVGGGAYGGTTFTVTVGLDANSKPIWTTVVNGSGAQVGTRAIPVEFWIQTMTGVEVNDIWSFDAERGVWSPTFPDVPKFNAIYAFILFGDYGAEDRYCIKQFGMTLSRPLLENLCIGGVFPESIRERGQREVIYSFEREYLDTGLRKRLESKEPFSVRLEAYGGEEFETGYEHEFQVISPLVVARGRTPSVTSKDEMTESIEAQAYPDPTNADDYFDDVTFLFQNSVADPNV